MVLVRRGVVAVDMDREGAGPPVVLLGRAARRWLWSGLAARLSDRYRVLTVDLYGRGDTPAWSAGRRQTLADQVRLVHALTAGREERIGIVGHSFGGAIALRAAVELDERVAALAVFDPTPFALLSAGDTDSWRAVLRERERMPACLEAGELEEGARGSVEFWIGPDGWAGLSPEHRANVTAGLESRLAEWDAMTDPALTLAEVATAPAPTLLALDPATLAPIREVADLLSAARPDWRRVELAGGGHLAPVTRPDLVNPLVEAFLDEHLGR